MPADDRWDLTWCLKGYKSVRFCGIPGIITKGCSNIFTPSIIHTFNLIPSQERFPTFRSTLLLCPLSKKETASVGNYRCLFQIFPKYLDLYVAAGKWRRLHNQELCELHCSQNIIPMINLRNVRWTGTVACMGRGVVLVWKPEGKRSLGRPWRIWEDHIIRDIK